LFTQVPLNSVLVFITVALMGAVFLGGMAMALACLKAGYQMGRRTVVPDEPKPVKTSRKPLVLGEDPDPLNVAMYGEDEQQDDRAYDNPDTRRGKGTVE
jgi:hypothetical protein